MASSHHIPRRARGAILNWFEKHSLPPKDVYAEMLQRTGFGDDGDLVPYLRETYGDDEAEAFRGGVTHEKERVERERLGARGAQLSYRTTASARDQAWQEHRPRLILLHLPDGLFASALEAACARLPYAYDLYHDAVAPPTQPEVNRIFEQQGIPYRLTEDGTVEWVGDEGVQELAVAPALNALRDERFATARGDFEHALTDVRRGSEKSRKDAVNDATQALEGAMVAVLEAHGVAVTKRQVNVMWQALRDQVGVPNEMQDTLVAASKLRNARTGHTNPEPVTQAEAEAAVASVATAITYLASWLPES